MYDAIMYTYIIFSFFQISMSSLQWVQTVISFFCFLGRVIVPFLLVFCYYCSGMFLWWWHLQKSIVLMVLKLSTCMYNRLKTTIAKKASKLVFFYYHDFVSVLLVEKIGVLRALLQFYKLYHNFLPDELLEHLDNLIEKHQKRRFKAN